MEKKLVFLDIDGTLIDTPLPPSPLVRKAVRLARSNGHSVFLCTGRNMPGIRPDILEVGFDGIIASAGGYVETGGKILFDSVMPEELVQECLEIFHQNHIFCAIESREGNYMDPQIEDLLQSAASDSRNAELIRLQKQAKEDMNRLRYEDYPRQGAYKISFAGIEIASIRRAAVALSDRFDVIVHPSRKYSGCLNGEIIRKEINKGRGMALVCQQLEIEPRNTIAFGDSMNDYSMLQCAGLSVAMGNACDELKSACDRVCEDVAHDGIYWEFMRMGLCNERRPNS